VDELAGNGRVSSRIELKTLEIDLGGRDRPDFGTVRPRVQIPGPRPKPEFRLNTLGEGVPLGKFTYCRWLRTGAR
jgi:hypothetical protein